MTACSRSGSSPPAPGGIYSESFDYATVQSDRLPAIASHGLELNQVMQPTDFRGPALTSLVQACATARVTLRAWVVLPKAQGYWPGETNLDAFGQAVDDLLAWIAQASLPIGWITFDLEPDWSYSQQMSAIMADASNPHRIDDFIALVKTHVDAAGFAAAKAKLQAIVDRVHAAGLRAHAVTFPMILDGIDAGNTYLEDGFDIPTTGVDWDEVTFMVYRSAWQAFTSSPLSSDLVYSYAVDAKSAFGDRAGIDLGVIGADPITGAQGYTDPAVLVSDVAAARAAGVAKVNLYSLEEALAQPDPGAWLSFAGTQAGPPPDDDPNVRTFRTLFAALDGALAGP
jgi:hypothetical protein